MAAMPMLKTTRDTVRQLFQVILSRLSTKGAIQVEAEKRDDAVDALVQEVGSFILTEEDLRDKALESIGKLDQGIDEFDAAQGEQYRAARAVIRKQFGDDVLNGLYFQEPLKSIGESVITYLLNSDHIEEVYDSDDMLLKKIVDIVRKFRPENLH